MKTIETQLKDVFSHPTAPYREGWVLSYLKIELKRLKIPFFQDQWGNILAGVKNKNLLKKSKRLALIAHTDHPGFHIISGISKNIYKAQWHGGHPPKVKGAKAAIYHPHLFNIKTRGIFLTNIDKKGFFKIKVLNPQFSVTKQCFGAFDFPAFSKKKTRITTRVADDLAGVTIILSVIERLTPKLRKHFLGIFTTAEETGFKGTMGLLYSGILGSHNTAISLEASKQIPDAIIGKGPVIRLGDRRSLFSQKVIGQIDEAANMLKNKVMFQRRIMNGGTCEATPFNMLGVACGGMAVPLGNYHNQKPNGKPGPEIIDLKDVENAVKILLQVYKNKTLKTDATQIFLKKLKTEFANSKKYFKEKIHYAY